MMRVGSLFSGYGGLEQGVQAALGGTVAWHSEVDKGACKVLAHRYPDVPNLGDITAVDWSAVEPVDVLTGGFPCQDVSTAGKRAGMTPDTRSGLWTHMAYAIDRLRPRLVVAENVRGLLSATATSDLEPCPWCLGDGAGVAPLRALGAVLGDLAVLGYDARWYGLRAADVGAPHGRFRVFVVAYPQRGGRHGWAPEPVGGAVRGVIAAGSGEVAAHPRGEHGKQRRQPAPGQATGGRSLGEPAGRGGMGTLLPTPRATDGTKGGPGQRGSSGDLMLPSAVALLPTPKATNNENRPTDGFESQNFHYILRDNLWGQYADAITRWEHLTRPAPPPTQLSTRGTPQLSPAFSEWLMGLPAGWVTDIPGVTRNEALKVLGNGVVPAQCEAALRYLLDIEAGAA